MTLAFCEPSSTIPPDGLFCSPYLNQVHHLLHYYYYYLPVVVGVHMEWLQLPLYILLLHTRTRPRVMVI